jgi:DNA-binding transcriptional MocR family regulator
VSAVAAPPAWVLALDLDSGSWRCLVGLWSYADFGTTGDAHVWPRREQLAERTGQSENALKKQLRKLAELGYIEAQARGWRLVWRAERGPQGPARILQAPKHAGPTGSGPDTTGPKTCGAHRVRPGYYRHPSGYYRPQNGAHRVRPN